MKSLLQEKTFEINRVTSNRQRDFQEVQHFFSAFIAHKVILSFALICIMNSNTVPAARTHPSLY